MTNNANYTLSVIFLVLVSAANLMILMVAGFGGEKPIEVLGLSVPIKSILGMMMLSFLANLYATYHDRIMRYRGGLVLCGFLCLLALLIIGEGKISSIVFITIVLSLVYAAALAGGSVAYSLRNKQGGKK